MRRARSWTLTLLLAALAPTDSQTQDSSGANARLLAIETAQDRSDVVVRLRLVGEFSYAAQSLSAPERFVLDLDGVVHACRATVLPPTNSLLARVRAAQNQTTPRLRTRVVLDLKTPVTPSLERVPEGLLVRLSAAEADGQPPRGARSREPAALQETPAPPAVATQDSSGPESAAIPAAASETSSRWLVTRNGSRIAIDGPWRVRGRLVLFTLPNGTLSSLPLSEVDLEASARPPETATAAQTSPTRENQLEPVLVLTDSDLHSAQLGESQEASDGSRSDDSESKPQIVVASWTRRQDPAGEGIEIVGMLRNSGRTAAKEVQVTVRLLSEYGEVLDLQRATVRDSALEVGATTDFRATFAPRRTFSSIEFDVNAQ